MIAALFAPIQDCDETFNYWEPTHYLSHGYGLQTWEYSPDYAIRSWLYVALHAVVGNVRRILPQSTKVSEFYFVRYGLALICAICQTIMFQAVSIALNARIGLFFLAITIISPGNFHASAAFLPSSFAMYMGMLGAASFMNWRGGLKTWQGITWFAVAGILGWPFAAALCVPYVLEELILVVFSDRDSLIEALIRFVRGVIASLIVLFFDFAVNLFFYKKPVVVSWNIVKYNIFSKTGGPDLYGTEPWTFYFKNLTLNFNIWFILALSVLPLFLLQKAFSASSQRLSSGLRTVIFITPFYMWLGIFTAQPHKEERFMYPAYPFLALNAALSLHIILSAIGNSNPKTLIGKIPGRLKLLAVGLVLFLSLDIAIARIYGIYSAYSAPLKVYSPLWGDEGGNTYGAEEDNVCFGKEWYRFPTSYFLPRNMHAKFLRSDFRGLLPGEFSEAQTGFGFWSGTWLPTSGLNDRNEEDLGKYVEPRMCSFLVDTQYPARKAPLSRREPDYIADKQHWEPLKCVDFLDAANTHILARTLWLPDIAAIPEKYQRKWGRHCLLQRKRGGRNAGVWVDPGQMMMVFSAFMFLDQSLTPFLYRIYNEHIPHPKSIMRYVLTLLPLPLWLITYRPSWLLRDVVAGLAVGLVMIPQSIVYARFANVTTAHGLYTSFAGLLLYFFLGSSKNIAVSATAIGSLLMGHNIHVIISKLGVGMYTAEEVAHGITIFAGFICFVFGALKLSRLVGLVPPVAVNAFTTATCIKVMMTQLPVLLGLRGVSTRGPPYVTIIGIFRYISHMRIDAAFGISTIVVLVAFGRLCAIMAKRQTTKKQFWDCFASFRLPITVGLSTIISYIINHSHDPSTSPFSLVGYIEPGLQKVQIPRWPEIPAIIIIISPEIIALGAANMLTPFAGGYLCTSSFGASTILSMAGSRSPLACAFAALTIYLALTYAVRALSYIPNASLAGIIVHSMYHAMPFELLIWILSVVIGLMYSLEWSIYLATILMSLLAFIRVGKTSCQTSNTIGERRSERMHAEIPFSPDGQIETPYPGVFVFLLEHSLFYFNESDYFGNLLRHIQSNVQCPVKLGIRKKRSQQWLESILDIPEKPDPESLPRIRSIILDFQRVGFLDSAAIEGLIKLRERVNQYTEPDKAEWYFANVHDRWTRWALKSVGFGSETYHRNLLDAVDLATKNAREKDLELVV
ncbi:Alg9-like mannosyltransferase family-domain-containing protein [Trichoderma asperelloides]|nr:Alg9-like mannosyltransferase family-domain-containing protein [Trichoderma asperelloides]